MNLFHSNTRLSLIVIHALLLALGCDSGASVQEDDTESDDTDSSVDELSCDDVTRTCSADSPCGDGSICSNAAFSEDAGFFGTMCYPACTADAPLSDCCPDESICVALDQKGTERACLQTGTAKKERLAVKLLPAGRTPNHRDVTYAGINTNVAGKKIPLNMSYAVEGLFDEDGDGVEEEVIILEFEGTAGLLGTWVLQITAPKELWKQGELTASMGDEDSQFDAVLSKWVGQEMTVYAILNTGSLNIREPGVVCSKAPCTKTDVDVSLNLVSISAKWKNG